jgi:predicted transcriptional regulator
MKENQEKKWVSFTIAVTPEDHVALKLLAEKRDTTLVRIARAALRRELAEEAAKAAN